MARISSIYPVKIYHKTLKRAISSPFSALPEPYFDNPTNNLPSEDSRGSKHRDPHGKTSHKDVINALLNETRVSEAKRMYEKMVRSNFIPDTPTHNTVIKGFAKAGRVEEALSLLKHMKEKGGFSPNTVTFNVLLGEPSKLGDVGRIEKILDLMIEDGCAPDHVTSDLLVRAFCYAGRDEEACNIFSEMVRDVVTPDMSTLNFLIRHLCKAGKIDRAYKFLEEMKGLNCKRV